MKSEDSTASIICRVLAVTPVQNPKIFALADVHIDIDGIAITIHGIQCLRVPGGSRVELPRYRGPDGHWRAAVGVPDELRDPIGAAVLEVCVEMGLAHRPSTVRRDLAAE